MTEPGDISRLPATRSVQQAVAAIAAGAMVVVVDDADREDEGDLILAAATVTTEQVAFVVRHTTGILCAPMSAERADALRLPPMVAERDNADAHGTAFTVTVDHRDSGTGVAAADRARTLRALADPATTPEELRRPGHVFPLRGRDGGVLVRAGHTEAALDLMALAGRGPVAVIGEIVAPDGSMSRGEQLRAFAAEHGLPVLAIADLVRYRRATECLVEHVATSHMPTVFGDFRAVAYRSTLDGTEHLAIVLGDLAAAGDSERGALVRVHSECLTGDILGSLRCDCGGQLEQALKAIADEGCGAVVYLRGHEGRGIGLAHKIRAYALQEQGLDTVDANTAQGLPVDSRSYGTGAQILADLGVRRIRLITNNPAKYGGLGGHGLHIVDRVAMPAVENPHNLRYLRTKQDRMGHQAPGQSIVNGS
ncbi:MULTISPECIES: bifunctional 3,4-dihydroxy-2-butanone-4-phosphate synthase/GTP cyclohydrolase II [unclassified Pseudonocardia]|jgi:3,4-dihydroxy 2-butanone 4-phosphate synthase/GTP cyclohydrolase II|uniref:bifunctional 3,4-dihydroxy-2-butanone-4-phosphate synthase/GTP cyclohydrolase II n=1 Tax=unclassified Pseudonocardia TaxID=2619320 RepID=UPI00095ED8DC|nr:MULTISPECIES: bifunctional 3,4-dihydroxy-2-butanone-4-phosphate synthase/GTP cyclohydrolase II [unclassified Pseudonocardia]MBN9098822.1 bifunctional 3,4-dihydroxy-2-butanone-4-phosphate synthase/GTP cyclohydrolase II [Pseudonocardia sp.]OJY40939.1 MAG: bifunctional 3,4-dihydroxy-2-butanone 4-phosphate synthase/GTP cyclohydrolase II [Pseudonocardia sp. 73-21]